MGIRDAHAYTHSVSGVSIGELYQIALSRLKQNLQSTGASDEIDNQINPNNPVIDIDSSWIYRSTNIVIDNRLNWMISLGIELSKAGFIVMFICDGHFRHHSKIASIDRKTKYQKSMVNGLVLRTELMKIAEKRKESNNAEDISNYCIEENELSKKIKTIDKQQQSSSINVGNEFFFDIKKAIEELPKNSFGNRNGTIEVVQALYQADSVMAYRSINNMSTIIFSSDSDLAALTGNCIGIKSFKFDDKIKVKNERLCNFVIYTPSSDVLQNIKISICLESSSTRIKQSKYPIFDKIDDINIRGLLAVGLGCDVFLPGVDQLGKTNLQKYIIANKNNLNFNNILNFYYEYLENKYKRKKKDPTLSSNDIQNTNDYNLINNKQNFFDAIQIFVHAFIYEPSNYFHNDIIIEEPTKYITNNKPEKLHKYLEEFANNNNDIEIYTSSNSVLQCTGCGNGQHLFLDFEDHYKCVCCNTPLCKYCCMKNNTKIYCYNCFLSEICVINDEIENQPSLKSMRDQLSFIGIETHIEDNVNDISDIYDAVVEKKQMNMYQKEQFLKINVPLLTSEYLDTEKIITRFNLKDGGSFIRHPKLSIQNKIDIINLLGKLVQNGNSNFKLSKTKIYSVLPDLIVTFAERARLHSGFRLLKRALRHAMDVECPSILKANCCIIEYDNNTGIHISHNIKASMKTTIYNIKVSFDSDNIISTSCTCKAGCSGSEKILCVHVLPILLQLSLLIFDGLGEHVLIELATDFNKSIEDGLSTDNYNKLRQSILLLRRANCDVDIKDLNNTTTILDLLKLYSVGTENSKKGPGPPVDISKLGPIRDVVFTSPAIKAENVMKGNSFKNKITNKKEDYQVIDTYIPYKIIQNLIEFIKLQYKNSKTNTVEDCIGFKLIQLRAENDIEINNKKQNVLKKQILDALNDASKEYRIKKNTSKAKNNFEKSIHEAEFCQVVNENVNYNLEENIEQDNSNVIINNNVTNNKRKKRYYCNALNCEVTTTSCPTAKFCRIPTKPKKKINEKSTDAMFETYYRKCFIRRAWLSRVGLPLHDNSKNLFICNFHNLEIEEIEYSWKNKLNEDKTSIRKIKLPQQKNSPPIVTRTQHKKRKAVYIKSPIKKKPKICDDTNNKSTTEECKEGSNIKKNKKINRYCNYVGCDANDRDTVNVKFYCVPRHPPILKEPSTNFQKQQHEKRIEYRKLFLRQIGLPTNEDRVHLRICNAHNMQTVRSTLNWYNKNKIKQSTKVTYNLPSSSSGNDNDNENIESKGLGKDRYLCNTINTVKKLINKDGNENLQWALTYQQTSALEEGHENINGSVAKAVGINVHKNRKFNYRIINEIKPKELTVVRLNKLTDNDVKDQTGFESKATLLCFIIIICNANIDLITTRTYKLSWFEEWYMFFEKIYSRSIKRWTDYKRKYKRCESVLQIIFSNKLKIVIEARKRWPRFVTLNEDEMLRQEKWNDTYKGQRVIMWDNTCIHLCMPQDPEIQRNTYSLYYSGNVAKGSIFVQLCGWMGTHELWVGAVSDSEYFIKSGILEIQNEYVPQYDIDNINVPWVNILDKGYRVTGAAWRAGKQFVLQPSFGKSDKKFSSIETLRSAAIASDRGGNERAVRLSKMSRELHDVTTGNQSMERLSDIWLTWSFQCNFIYKPVL